MPEGRPTKPVPRLNHLSLTLLAAAADAAITGAHEPIYWVNLGLKNYLFRIGSFELRWYSLAYLAGIVLGYWLRVLSAGVPFL